MLNKFLVTILGICFISNVTFAGPDKTINLALIADKTSGFDKSPLVSLFEVELSQKENIQLLERATIDTLLEEQQLSAVGLLDRNTTIRIGKLLRADAFLILSIENQSKESGDLIRVRVSETAHGLRLMDFFEQSDNTNPTETTKRIIEKIENTLKKISQPDENLIPVGIVDIHRVQLGERYKMLERTLPAMLSVRLSLEPQIIMLEREDLKVLLDEKLMTQGDETEFWSSAVLIDGYIQPNNGQLELHLNIKQSSGDDLETFVIPVEPNETFFAIDQASTKIIRKLQDSPLTTKWDIEKEAEQFYKQGKMLERHARYEEALPLFESAHALQFNNVYYTGTIFSNEWASRQRNTKFKYNNIGEKHEAVYSYINNWKPNYSDYELVEIVSILVRQLQKYCNEDKIRASDIHNLFSSSLGDCFGHSMGYFGSHTSIINEEIKKINRDNRKIWIETYDTILQRQFIRPDYPRMNSLIRARLAWISSDDPKELIANIKNAFNKFVISSELDGEIIFIEQREYLMKQAFLNHINILTYLHFNRTFLKDSRDEFSVLLRQYILELNNIENKTLSNTLNSAIKKQKRINTYLFNDNEITNADNNKIDDAQKMLDSLTNSNEILDSKTKKQIIFNIRDSLASRQLNDNINERRRIWENLCNFLIKQKDIYNLIEVGTHYPFPVTDFTPAEHGPWLYHLLDRISDALHSHQTKQVMIAMTSIRDAQLKILNNFPELNDTHTKQNTKVKMLLSRQDWPQSIGYSSRMIKYVFQNDILWVAFKTEGNFSESNSYWPNSVGIAGINIKENRTIALWQTDIKCSDISELSGITIGNTSSYISVKNGGIIRFPGSSIEGREYFKKNSALTPINGLPSNAVTSIAFANEKLWIAYGDRNHESGLGLYNPENGKWKSIFCSTLKDNNPFSEGKPYQINSMIYVQPNVLFFSISGIENYGLWKLNTDTYDFKYLKPIYCFLNNDLGNNILLTSESYYVKFEPNSEQMTIIIRDALKYPQKREPLAGLHEEMFLPESFLNSVVFGPYYAKTNLDLSTGTIHNNKLWARLGEKQILIIKKENDFNKSLFIENNILDGKPVKKFISTPYGLVGIGEGIVGLIETDGMEN